jgi:CheY-like chemotaxis protein
MAEPNNTLSTRRPLVAVVDDEDCVRRALVRLMRLASCDVVAYSSAHDLLQALDDLDVDCLVLDLQMPDMTGLEVQSYLRMTRSGAPIPVVIITAHDDPGIRERCLAAGATAYLRKPIEAPALLAAVRRLTESRCDAEGLPRNH